MSLWEELFSTPSIGIEATSLRLLLATVLGFIVGLDRELRGKPLGMRTFMLVSIGAALFSLMAVELTATFAQKEQTQIDPGRVIQGLVIGIGFLGGGAIIQTRGGVIGGTTGATIWAVGGIGMACGFGFYLHAVLVTVASIFVLAILRPLEQWLGKDQGLDM